MQAIRPLLPEFDGARRHAIAGPVRRPRHRAAGEARRRLGVQPFEFRPAGERPGLRRGPGADLAVARTGGEISVGLGLADERGSTLDPHLPLQRFPVQGQRGTRIMSQLDALATVGVGVEREAARESAAFSAGRGAATARPTRRRVATTLASASDSAARAAANQRTKRAKGSSNGTDSTGALIFAAQTY